MTSRRSDNGIMGNIRKRSKNTWTIQWDEPRAPGGRRRQRSKAVHGTKRDAEVVLAEIERQIRMGAYVKPANLTLTEYLDMWLEKSAAPRVGDKTLQEYRQIVHNHLDPALGNLVLQRISPLDIQSYIAAALKSGRMNGKGGLSDRTVRHHYALLHSAFNQAVRWQLMVRNPVDAVDPPRVASPEMVVLREEDIPVLVNEAKGTDLYIPIMIALGTGLRRGEILGLTFLNVDLKMGTISVVRSLEQTRQGVKTKQPKTHRSRRPVRLPPELIRILRAHKAAAMLRFGPDFSEDCYVCLRRDGSAWPPDVFSHRFTDMVRHLDIPRIRFHDLRHTVATISLKHGVHPKTVSEMLGHSSVNITLDTYSHVLPDIQDQAAAKINDVLRNALYGKTS